MINADFEEKQFEGAFNAELAVGRGRVFTPGQVEENVLGYDAAAVPDPAVADLVAELTGVHVPPAIWLTPNWWLRCPRRPAASVLPNRFASLLLQYKRPALEISPGTPLFAAHGGAYFRYRFTRDQHRTLVRLDEALNDAALVRYAAPCTISRRDLEQWQLDREVMRHTNLVSPRRIGLRHQAWTFRNPGGIGFRNEFAAGDDAIRADDAEELLSIAANRPDASAPLDQHTSEMLRRIAGETVDVRVRDVVGRIADDDAARAVAVVLRIRLIGLSLAETQTSWWLLEL